jgi:hypothetical protein
MAELDGVKKQLAAAEVKVVTLREMLDKKVSMS